MATLRLKCASNAVQTAPMPPRANSRSRVYFPPTVRPSIASGQGSSRTKARSMLDGVRALALPCRAKTLLLDADLDGGAIDVVEATDPRAIDLLLRPDTRAEFMQWFCFRLRGAARERASIRILNAGESTYPDA